MATKVTGVRQGCRRDHRGHKGESCPRRVGTAAWSAKWDQHQWAFLQGVHTPAKQGQDTIPLVEDHDLFRQVFHFFLKTQARGRSY